MSSHRMEQVELRIRYLLDLLWRSLRRTSPPTPTHLISTADPTLNGDIICKFDKYMTPISAVEVGVRYCCAYQRIVPIT